MAKEIEHKYLVVSEEYVEMAKSISMIIQGYLSKDPERTVRIRIRNTEAFITVKGKTSGDTREEFEYNIPLEDAEKMMHLCIGTPLKKERYVVEFKGFIWEVDRFLNCDSPTVAEIELRSSAQSYPIPPFVGEEVTGNPKYYNSNL